MIGFCPYLFQNCHGQIIYDQSDSETIWQSVYLALCYTAITHISVFIYILIQLLAYILLIDGMLKAPNPHIVAWWYFKINCHQSIQEHDSFIHVYQTKILIEKINFDIKVLILLSSFMF